ncbi:MULTISPECIES: hypothetical protein [Flavobacterium]|uniref:hypothetical protein n=1 Tax=Flavobacterium TaxID=237 RepID=UPI001FCB75A6|nr:MULTISPECIES: hypothetical protein [Flavobacterium]UOK41627.1 hypothetical protein LZF87_09920 [Flavobacterium enshiense]
MKNKLLKITFLSILFAILSVAVWIILPISIKYYSEISFGNRLIENLQKYKVSNFKLPNNQDWETLDKLDFEKTELTTNPEYKKIGENDFKLIFIKGFDGPYLTYNSVTKDWKVE